MSIATTRTRIVRPLVVRRRGLLTRHPRITLAALLLGTLAGLAIFAPFITEYDPMTLAVTQRLRPPSAAHWFGTDAYGRDTFSRTIYGGRISMQIGVSVAAMSVLIGVVVGMLGGAIRWLDPIVMRISDGLMSIPAILLAIALMSLTKASVATVIIAITIPEVPRVIRLVRSLVLTIREQTYMQAAIASGTRLPRLMLRHILPNVLTPLIVQATYICASAVLLEAYLGFLGAGTPTEVPSWGNIIAENRTFVQLATWNVMFPGVFLALMVLGVNMLGDGVRDLLDPRLAGRIGK
ncbi:MAG: ABC transporter permease [Alphaproteobacteria bacterium]|nr:ABC transporter permease [Alphaproteobacteria bacterium]